MTTPTPPLIPCPSCGAHWSCQTPGGWLILHYDTCTLTGSDAWEHEQDTLDALERAGHAIAQYNVDVRQEAVLTAEED